jgi:CO/xanthine dehydrogenase Mo-binding subunit
MTRLLSRQEISRKSFLRGGGGLVVGLSLAGAATAQAANDPRAPSPAHTGAVPGPPDAAQIDSWLQFNPDNTATLFGGNVELGQGTPTSLRMIAAEELDLAFDQVLYAQVDTNTSLSAATVGSGSTQGALREAGNNVRTAAAAARAALLKLASAQLGVPVGNLSVANGVVSGGGKSVAYADLIAGKLFNSTIAAQRATLKQPGAFKVIGTRVPRQDIPAIVTGKQTYVQNIRVPGMLHGRVVRPRGQAAWSKGATLRRVDERSIAHIPDAQVVRRGNFLGVVAPKEYDAVQAAAQLKVVWDETPSLPGNGNLAGAMRDPARLQGEVLSANSGNVGAGLAAAKTVVSRSFFTPYQSHGVIGPNAAVADVRPGSAHILAASQIPYSTRTLVFNALQKQDAKSFTNAAQVRVQVYPASGTYGHSGLDDITVAAALLSQAVGKPVRAQFMRWDEHGWDNLGPAYLIDVRAGIDASGKIVGYDYTSFQHGWMAVETNAELSGVPLPQNAGTGNADTTSAASYYDIPNRRVTSKRLDGYKGFLKGTYLRAPAAPQSLFASESVIDELAYLAKLDPIAFRKLNLDTTTVAGQRWADVLDTVAKLSSWKPRVSASALRSGNVVRGRGVAMGGFAGALPASVVDIEVDRKSGKIAVKHVYTVQDNGLGANPASIENQMVGCVIQACSRALLEEVRFSKVRQTSLDWVSYPILRFKDAPAVTVKHLQRLDQPAAGSGEPATAAIAAGIANAFFDATGARLTRVPFTPGYVRGVLANAKSL